MNGKDHFAGLDTDPLTEMLDSAAAGNAPAARKELPASYQPKEHFEPCGKCRGTGQTRWGVCFRCNGKRGKTFKTAPAERAKKRAQVAAKRQRTAEESIEAFKVEHPDVWAWIDGNNFGFAIAMHDAIGKYGSLTENQLAASRRCIANLAAAKAASAERKENAPTIEIAAIEDAFKRALGKVKKPRLRIGNFRFSLAPAHGQNAGAIYVRDGQEYLGKIVGGKFLTIRSCGAEREAEVIKIAADPKTATIAHGRKFGQCGVCGIELTDPDSIAAGIGPVCATRMGW